MLVLFLQVTDGVREARRKGRRRDTEAFSREIIWRSSLDGEVGKKGREGEGHSAKVVAFGARPRHKSKARCMCHQRDWFPIRGALRTTIRISIRKSERPECWNLEP